MRRADVARTDYLPFVFILKTCDWVDYTPVKKSWNFWDKLIFPAYQTYIVWLAVHLVNEMQ